MRVAFDIDDTLYKIVEQHDYSSPLNHPATLLYTAGVKPTCVCGKQFKQVPDYDLLQVLFWFVFNGDEVFVWSAGGEDYARMVCGKLGIDGYVRVIPKVALNDDSNPHRIDIAFDDCETKLAKVDVLVRRNLYDEKK